MSIYNRPAKKVKDLDVLIDENLHASGYKYIALGDFNLMNPGPGIPTYTPTWA